VSTRVPASERTSQKLDEVLSRGVADGDARAELLKLAVRKIAEEALEAEVAEALGPRVFTRTAPCPAPATVTAIGGAGCGRPRAQSITACRKSRIARSRSCPECARGWPAGRPSWNGSPWRCSPGA
jgi:hypothetical protein